MIIWLNGTFGAGKTTTGRRLAGRLANARPFDPEEVGYLLMRTLEDHEFRDFQDLAPWRELVPVFTESIARFTGQHLIAVQTVLREDYWRELTEGFKKTRLDIFHVLLHVDSDVLAERITADQVESGACQWRLDHIGHYEKARPWMESAADFAIDTTRLPAAGVAERIAVEAEKRMAGAPSLCGGICPGAAIERACDQEPVAAQYVRTPGFDIDLRRLPVEHCKMFVLAVHTFLRPALNAGAHRGEAPWPRTLRIHRIGANYSMT